MIGVRDFREGGKEEEDDEQGDEAGDAEICPLHVFEALLGVDGVSEEDARGEEGSDEGADSLDALAEVEADLLYRGGPQIAKNLKKNLR